MAKAGLSRQQLLEYAKAGAQARIQQLRTELAALEAEFGAGSTRGSRRATAGAALPEPTSRKRRKMSAAGRARIAAAAKARWAKWRKDKEKK